MKKLIVKTLAVLLLVLLVPAGALTAALAIPAQYSETYYGELPEMYDRLKGTQGKKIVLVGCSGLVFGVNGALLEQEFPGYTVCPFALYGSVGTKAMMELSRPYISEGDIVILAPEIGPQTLSLYFNGENMWLASDGRADILRDLPAEEAANMAEALPAFLSGKYRCWKEEAPPRPEGVYARSSFNERCDLIYERPCNIMDAGFDPTSPVSYDTGIIAEDFLPYVNEFNRWVTGRGAVLLFTFTPVNRAGIREGEGEAEILAFAEHVIRQLDCPVIGDPRDLVLDPEWFYDSNVHCNSAGTLVYTRLLAEAVKAWQGDTSPTRVPIPEKPPMQGRQEEEQGEDADAGCFVYEETERGSVITGLTAQGASRQTLTVPVHTPDGKAVRGLSASAFAGNTVIREIRLQSNIRALENHSFDGCTALVAVYLAPGEAPSYCQVDPSGGLTAGAPQLRIYVEKDKLTDYLFNYFWSGYGSVLEGY